MLSFTPTRPVDASLQAGKIEVAKQTRFMYPRNLEAKKARRS